MRLIERLVGRTDPPYSWRCRLAIFDRPDADRPVAWLPALGMINRDGRLSIEATSNECDGYAGPAAVCPDHVGGMPIDVSPLPFPTGPVEIQRGDTLWISPSPRQFVE